MLIMMLPGIIAYWSPEAAACIVCIKLTVLNEYYGGNSALACSFFLIVNDPDFVSI